MKLFITSFLFLFLNIITYSQNTTSLKPTETAVLVNVTVTNFENVPRANDLIIFKGTKNKIVLFDTTNASGQFSILLPKGDTYKILYKEFTDSTDYSEVEIPNTAGKYTSDLTIQIEPAKVYTLEDVFFDTGLSTLKPESYKALNDLVDVLKLKPAMIIEIDGHTDNTGTKEINQKLSQDRANAVMNYLIKKGISSTRLTAKGFGDTLPVADNDTEEGKAKNRRTEVKIIKE
jgi:OmpA-OmpF porin, OOP family